MQWPGDSFALHWITPGDGQSVAEPGDCVIPVCVAKALRGGPAREITDQVIELPIDDQVEGGWSDFLEGKWERSKTIFHELRLGRPEGSHDIRIKMLHERIDFGRNARVVVAPDRQDAAGPHDTAHFGVEA